MSAKGTRNRRRFNCLDCNQDTGKLKEFYYLNLALWLKLVGSKTGMLCIGCLELRLGRMLVRSDFTDASINSPRHGEKSERLLARLTS